MRHSRFTHFAWASAILLALGTQSARAAFLTLDPTETGQIQELVVPDIVTLLDYEYTHEQPLSRVELTSILGSGPPDTIGGIANHTVGYLLYDLATLAFNPLAASVLFEITAEASALTFLQITSIDTITPQDLSLLPSGTMTQTAGNDLRRDIGIDGDVLGSRTVGSGSQAFAIDLNPLGLATVTGAGNGLLAIGITYEWPDSGGTPDINARAFFNSTPQLVLSDTATVPVMPTTWLLAVALAGLSVSRTRRRRKGWNPCR